ncbi:MAG TPA: hypothetical protein VGA22_06325 [Gemmatimonadales bacterium]
MSVADWVESRLSAAPEALRRAVVNAVNGQWSMVNGASPDPQDLMAAAERVLAAIDPARTDRQAAFQLLAADALVTMACEERSARGAGRGARESR